jgi:hypothetical protein
MSKATLKNLNGLLPEWTFDSTQLIMDPNYPQTEELCLDAVKFEGDYLSEVKVQTETVCLAAVRNRGKALQYCTVFSQEICDAAINNDIRAIKFVPQIYQTEELACKVVARNGFLLEYIKNQTPKVVETALADELNALRFVKNQTRELILDCIKRSNVRDVMGNIHYSTATQFVGGPKVYTQDQLTNIVLRLECSSDVKTALLKNILQ